MTESQRKEKENKEKKKVVTKSEREEKENKETKAGDKEWKGRKGK